MILFRSKDIAPMETGSAVSYGNANKGHFSLASVLVEGGVCHCFNLHPPVHDLGQEVFNDWFELLHKVYHNFVSPDDGVIAGGDLNFSPIGSDGGAVDAFAGKMRPDREDRRYARYSTSLAVMVRNESCM
eukprot:gene24547-50556_t